MKISQNSTLSIYQSLRHSVSNLQYAFVDAQKEVSTGRVTDPGLALGGSNARRVSMVNDIERLHVITDTNNLAKARLEMSLTATGAINEVAQDLLSALSAGVNSSGNSQLTQRAGESALSAITSTLNTTLNGEAIFGGINSGQDPIADYANGGPKAAVDAAFLNNFGFTKDDPLAASITKTQMLDFLDNAAAPLFSGVGWTGTFSSASDDIIVARIGLNEHGDASVSANEQGFRNAMFAAVIATEFFSDGLSAQAKSAAAERALELVGSSSGQLANTQSRAGFLVNRIDSVTERMSVQLDELTAQSDTMVAVDPYEAATRLNSLITQIETSYTLTGRIQQLSLMRFL